ncbi:MAG: HDIG domain-containing protein [Ignavibacteriae bacterium]|nr:HDIG domain-containing protein [Ignavibacteriota bacterium]
MTETKKTLLKKIRYKESESIPHSGKGLRYSKRTKVIIFILTALFCTFFFSFHFNTQKSISLKFSAKPGNIWTSQPLVAEFTYPIFKDLSEYNKEVSKAKEKTLPVFALETSSINQSMKVFNLIISNLQNYINNTPNNIGAFFTIDELRKFDGMSLAQKQKDLTSMVKLIKYYLAEVYRYGLTNISLAQLKNNEVTIQLPPNNIKIISKDLLSDSITISEKASKYLNNKISNAAIEISLEIISRCAVPNLVYSKSLTDQAFLLSEQSVAKTEGMVRKGESIVSKGQVVTNEILKKIRSYENSKLLRSESIYSIWYFLGSFGHSVLIYTILLIYLFFIRKKIFYDNLQISILSVLLILIAFMSWLSIEISTPLPLEFLIMLPAFSMLSAIVFDSRTAFYVTVTMALMVSGIRGNDYDVGISMMFAGTLAAYTVRDIQSRTQMFLSIFYILIGLSVSIIVIGLERSADFSASLNKLLMALVNSSFSPLVTYGLLFVIERTTNFTTDLRLQEYVNLNHPILTKLSELAPGTYQHTLSMAQLAERCAIAINSNPLLTKVGAYFHDIGKISKPEYFSENQIDIDNKHEMLSPRKSADAIKNHVVDGIKIAHDSKLPQRLIDFIPMHHGTSLVKHFYAKAIEMADGEPVNDEDFRYPGPKPNSKETAIVMICDSIEALSRVPFKEKEDLEKAVDRSLKDKLLDGQLDESNLTMTDINIIKETCIKFIQSISHPRVEYKEIPEEKSDTVLDSGNGQ